MDRSRKNGLDYAVFVVGVLIIVVLSLMVVSPTRWTLHLSVPVPTLTKEQQWNGLMDELYVAADENDRGEIWRLLGEIDRLLGKQWPSSPVQIDAICDLCTESGCGKSIGICAECRKHSGR